MAHFKVCMIGGGVAAMFYLTSYKPEGGVKVDYKNSKLVIDKEKHALDKTIGSKDEDEIFADHLIWAPLSPWVIHGKDGKFEHIGRGDDYGMGQSPWINSVKKPSEFNYDKSLMARESFYEEQSQILWDAKTKKGLTEHHGMVTGIVKVDQVWKITGFLYGESDEEVTVTADKVLIMTGVGEDIEPGEECFSKLKDWKYHPRIRSLDQFMRAVVYEHKVDDKNSGTVVIQGGSAAIDAVWQALRRGYKVIWLSGNRGAQMLPESPLKRVKALIEAKSNDDGEYHEGRPTLEIEVQENKKLKVTRTNGERKEWVDVDCYVYALGQDPSKGERSVVRLLAGALGISKEDTKRIPDERLEPLLDRNLALFDTRTQDSSMPKGIVGLRLKHNLDNAQALPICDLLGTASQVVLDTKSRFLRGLLYTVYHQVGTVLDVRQIGGIRAVMQAYNTNIEDYMAKDAELNFSAAMPNDIASFLATRYDLPPALAGRVTDLLLWLRLQRKYTNGFDKKEVERLMKALEETETEVAPLLEKAEKKFQDVWKAAGELEKLPTEGQIQSWPRAAKAGATWGLSDEEVELLGRVANGLPKKEVTQHAKTLSSIWKKALKSGNEGYKKYTVQFETEPHIALQALLWNEL